MRVGKLDRRITILKRAAGKNTLGEKLKGFSDGETLWSSHTPVSDGERLRNGQSAAVTVSRFVVRYSQYSSLITHNDRVRFDGAEWRITGLKELERRRWIEITAEKMVGAV